MTRVLLVHGGVDLYGSGLACAWIAEGAAAVGIDVEVVLPTTGPLFKRLLTTVPIHLVDPVPLRGSSLRSPAGVLDPIRWLPQYRKMRELGRSGRFDVVHTNTSQALGGLTAARAADAPLVWSVHELFRFGPGPLYVYQRFLRRADVVTACSQAAASQFTDTRVREICQVVYTGADLPPPGPAPPLVDESVIRLVAVGRLVAWKGHDVVVKAVADLVQAGLDVHLTVVGGSFGSDRRQEGLLRSLVADLALQDRVDLVGDRTDVSDIVGACDIFVQPSRTPEPFGIALVEAMALGRVCIATDQGGPAEILADGSTGYLVAPDDPKALARLLSKIASDRFGARQVAEAGRLRSKQFSSSDMVASVLDIYRRLT